MISGAKAYARARLTALGLNEWSDGFNFENIPRTLLDGVFHVELGQCVGAGNNQAAQHIECPITVRIFVAPGFDPRTLIDDGVTRADAIIDDMLKAENRLSFGQCVTDVRFNSMGVRALAESNDNGIIVELGFTVLVIISTY